MPKVIKETVFTDCPIRNVLARISGKWSLLVLYTLDRNGMSPMRFNQLRRAIPDISQKVLTTTLRTLETDGLICRKVFAEVPPRVEYSLTERALTLIPLVDSLINWAADNMADIVRDRAQGIEPVTT
ncbi:helix-turn-helix domain-containing protein [Hallella sp.]|uniref:winged helix-turn-helix transcriptional regulator n=1 Tax=Hallella TaxID=52228 RepID=UPI0028428DDE|nr:helix-turn-helix domain-containing protein [Hallella sp.]MCI7433560.1 helix-turn-helix transcriptional regulator [Prevotella sp.]MDR3843911.1 helix-turn-helix domain-containing protein [Hallella sp.]MDR4001267.1 helix-turn-helix domain-containing protein [Hallella sp.]MED9945769.1 helix-turn-helix domain-containing protein [Hallella sp.]